MNATKTINQPSIQNNNFYPSKNNVKTPALDKLWREVMSGKSTKSGSQLLHNITTLRKKYKQAIILNPTHFTTVHQLYEKAAEQFAKEGKIDEVFRTRALAAKKIKFLPSHPLYNLNDAIKKGAAKQADSSFGAHFSHLGAGVVKGGNIRAEKRNIEGSYKHCFEFRLSHPHRKLVDSTLNFIKNHKSKFEENLPENLKKGVTITEVSHFIKGKNNLDVYSDNNGYNPNNAKALQIEFPGKGKVFIGNTPECGCLYNNVSVELDANLPEGKGVETLHQMLSVLGMGPVLCQNRKMDNERMKVAQIFRSYFPVEAYPMERSLEFYEMPVYALKNKIEQKVPQMKETFKKYLDTHPELIKEMKIYEGKKIYCLTDLADQMRAKGAYGLISGINGGSYEGTSNTLVQILKKGGLSSADRFQSGLFSHGASSASDFQSGGGDQVFTRMITSNLKNKSISSFPFHGQAQVLWDLDVVNRGSYGYTDDNYGTKNEQAWIKNVYNQRSNLINLTQNISSTHTGNEVMVKNRISPGFIRGIVVQSPEMKNILIQKMDAAGLLKNVNGKKSINGKLIDQFIHVSDHFSSNMWSKPKNKIKIK